MNTETRLHYIDLLKGIGIICVIIGHCNISNELLVWIYMFHMPLFFFLSGYVNKSFSFGVTILNNIKSILYPYIVLGLCIIAFNVSWDFFVNKYFSFEKIGKRFAALAYGNVIWENNWDYIGTLWFLAALFSVRIIWALIEKSRNYKYYIGILITFLGLFLKRRILGSLVLPLCLDVALVSVFFFMLGTSVKAFEQSVSLKIKLVGGVGLLLFGTAVGYLNSFFFTGEKSILTRNDLMSIYLGDQFLYYISSSMIVCGLLFLTEVLYHKIKRCRILETVGKASLLIMVVHLYVKRVWDYALFRFGKTVPVIITILVVTIVSFAISQLIIRYMPFLYKYQKRRKT